MQQEVQEEGVGKMANGTSINDLLVVDDEYNTSANTILQKATRMQEIWDDYLNISIQIAGAQGSIEGKRAEGYAEFTEEARARITQRILEITEETKKDKLDYLEMINEADDVIY